MSSRFDDDEILATVEASPARRVMGVTMLGALGLLMAYVAASTAPGFGWQLFLVVIAGIALWLAYRMWQATAHRIELTPLGLRCSDGVEIVSIADLQVMDRGFFAFKPSNGFLMRARTKAPRAWYPGLWWRTGRRIGVGGVTPGSQTKAMTEIIAALIVERDHKG